MRGGAGRRTRSWSFPRIVADVGGLMFLVFGLWAMVDPRSFFDSFAKFPPYNQHFMQDIGAFQIGMGAVLLLALRVGDALAVALLGTGAGAVAHAISHVIGRDLGGKPETDIPMFGLIAVLLVAAGVARLRAPIGRG